MDRILIIDDDVELCGLVGEYLESEGFRIEAVYDGERGLERARQDNSVRGATPYSFQLPNSGVAADGAR